MITRRIVVNLISFLVLSGALVAYGFLDLLGNPLSSGATISTVLPSAAGLSPGFIVTLAGVDVGSVQSVALAPSGAKVTMHLDPGHSVPNDVAARITIANALGQQEMELVPQHAGAAPPLRNGAVVPAAADSLPADVGTVVAEATKLLQAIPPGQLNSLLHTLAVALNGNGQNLKTIASASELFSQEFLAYQQQFESLLQNAPPVLDTVSANAPALRQALADTAVLARVLADKSPDVTKLLDQGASASEDLNALVTQNEPNLACLIHDFADVNSNLAQPTNLSNLSTTLATNEQFFGAVAGVAPSGPAIALTKNDAPHQQEWLRTRLLLPPPLPPADSYIQALGLPAVLPGAGCSTEFGQGVGPGLQANFKAVGPGGHVVAPSASESHVRGGGSTPDAAPAAARLSPAPADPGAPALPALAGLGVLTWMITMARRRPSRAARPVRALVPAGRRRTR